MYIYRLSHALGDAGHQVDVIHCVDSYHLLHPAEPEMDFSGHPNVTAYGLRSGYKWLSPLLTHQTGRPLLKQKRISELLRTTRYDILHFHNISLLGPRVMALETVQERIVKMYTTHEHWLICPTHVLWKLNSRPCEKPECLRCTISAKRPPQAWRYTGLLEDASKHIDQFVSPSRFTAEMHAKRGFGKPVAHLPYFIERVDGDWKSPGQRPQERPYFLFVGRLEQIKGLQTLIRIWDKTGDFDLLVAGTGTFEAQLRAQAASNPRIRFLGALAQRELGSLYFHAIACIVPSLTYETFGMIIIESFARKTPVIVHDLGALPEVVSDSQGGFVYRTDEELLGAIQELAASPALRSELGENGYRAFLRWWTKEAHLDLYFDFLNGVAERKYGSIPWNDPAQAKPSSALEPGQAAAATVPQTVHRTSYSED